MKHVKLSSKIAIICYMVLSTGLTSSCGQERSNDPNCGEWILGYTNDNNWSRQHMIVDSIEMKSLTEAKVWVKGKEISIHAKSLFPMYEPCR